MRKSEKAQGKQKAHDLPPWEERTGDWEEERVETTHEEAIRVAIREDPGLVWLREQCKPNLRLLNSFTQWHPVDEQGWANYYPGIEEMPKGWPGKESDDGLRVEHLTPDCEL